MPSVVVSRARAFVIACQLMVIVACGATCLNAYLEVHDFGPIPRYRYPDGWEELV